MIYLDNKTLLQELYIPRQEYISVTTGSSGTYAEGYADGVNDQKAKLASTAFTENGDYQRNDGWSAITVNVPQSGSSVLEGKEIVVSQDVTIVVPTSGYDGFSAVTVDATEYGQTNYDSGYTDGFNSGYTSGETHQKSLLVSTAITQNGSYQRENGYSAITVNVPTGQTYNIEQNKPFTATSNGNYTINPSEIWSITYDSTYAMRYVFTINGTIPQTKIGKIAYIVKYDDEDTGEEPSVVIIIGSGNTLTINKNNWDEDDYGNVDFMLLQGKYRLEFDNDNLHSSDFSIIPYNNGEKYDVMSAVSLNVNVETASTYQSGYTSGYTDGFNSGYTSGETHQKSLLVSTAITQNGSYSRENGYSAITVNVPQTGSTAVLGVGSFSANGTYSASTDNLDGYSAITINVPTGMTSKDIVICTSGGCWFTTEYELEFGDQVEVEHCTFGKDGAVSFYHQQYIGGNNSELFRIGEGSYIYLKYFSSDGRRNSFDDVMSLPNSGSAIEDKTILFNSTGFTVDGNVVTSYTTTDVGITAYMIFFANNENGGDVVEKQTAKMGRVKIYGSDGTLKATFEPRLDEFNVPYFKYIEQDIDIYASGNIAPFYEEIIIDPSYQSGYTSGYTDGYDSGYTSGYTDGYDSGYTSGQTDGLNSGYTEGYNSGYTEGQNDVISTFSSITITQNGQYGDSAHPMSSITVNVPQSGYSINDLALRNYTINNPSITASTIEESAFEGCSGLTGNLELGSSVLVIKEGAFCGSSISEIIWPQNIDGGAFSVTSMTMRDGCQFAECQNLEYVEVPSYVTFSSVTINASSGMFYNCQNLVNVDYYASRIPTRCFDGCIGLEYIYIDNITSIGQKAFYGCTHLTSIRFAQQNPPTVSNSDAFSYVPSGGTLYVPFGRSSAYQSYLNYLTNWTIVEDEE